MRKSKAKIRLKNKAKRHAELRFFAGRQLELTIDILLKDLVKARLIRSSQYYFPNSKEDKAGKDFCVTTNTGKRFEFGVTTNYTKYLEQCRKRPKIGHFHFHIGTSTGAMQDKILEALAALDADNKGEKNGQQQEK